MQARFLGASAVQFLREEEISEDELAEATGSIGEFGGDNRAGIPGTLHRISCMRNRRGNIVRALARTSYADNLLDVTAVDGLVA